MVTLVSLSSNLQHQSLSLILFYVLFFGLNDSYELEKKKNLMENIFHD